MVNTTEDIPVHRGDDLTGAVLNDRYEVVGKLGVGGMALVYEGRRIGLHKKVAIKVLKPELAEKAENVKRFLREARAASVIEHENIVDIVDFGPTDRMPVYFVMEFLEGRDLRSLIKAHGAQEWPLCREVILEIVGALEAAHHKGIIHRDVKPANIYLVPRDNGEMFVKVLDFGIAKIIEDGRGITRGLTQTNGIIGTVAYMAPEQAYGAKVDARTDLYAVGVVLYEMLVGRPPFKGRNHFLVLEQHVNEPPPPPRSKNASVPAEVEAIVLKCLEKDPANRYQNMAELRQAILGLPEELSVPPITEERRSDTERLPGTPPVDTGPMGWQGRGGTEKFGTQPPQGEMSWNNPPESLDEPLPPLQTEPLSSGDFDRIKDLAAAASHSRGTPAGATAKSPNAVARGGTEKSPRTVAAPAGRKTTARPAKGGSHVPGMVVGFGFGIVAAGALVWFGLTQWSKDDAPPPPPTVEIVEIQQPVPTPVPVATPEKQDAQAGVVPPPSAADATSPAADPEEGGDGVSDSTPPPTKADEGSSRRRKNRRRPPRDRTTTPTTAPTPTTTPARSDPPPTKSADDGHTVHPDLKNPYGR